MVDSVSLPLWLDDYIFNQLKANYCPSNSDMTVIDWDKSNVLNYLGTYFPRSYAESYCIFRNFFIKDLLSWIFRDKISIFDFGCGTGGEIIGLLMAIGELSPNLKLVEITVLDGNHAALRIFENVIKEYLTHTKISITYKVIPQVIEDFYDLSILDAVVTQKFDIIMSFKSICEFVTKERFEQQNAYEHIAKTFLPKLENLGIMVLADVTTYNSVSQEWLPTMMDKGLSKTGCNIVMKNAGYNQRFIISHSRHKKDESKVAWRIIQTRWRN
ncbi:class I SAM-dependent methyltransferase [Bacteroides sp. ET71]|uniref:class I SAM-dependent methyltransferase n=1 Tax=Bacteroides sp. ET71 TaxID=2939421 RepID=UPI0020117B78|nr:class I SAM-dependent methyltransferase [Bacteroides sp. ET71]MCL1617685.1 class I SAM-dependent methyltransferase [Bacteroides sp. ET71]